MVFEIVFPDRKKYQERGEEETFHGNSNRVMLTKTGKVLPAVMLVAIFMLLAMHLDFNNFVSRLDAFYNTYISTLHF